MKKNLVVMLPLIILSILSLHSFRKTLLDADFSDWRIYAAGVGAFVLTSLTSFFIKRLMKGNDVKKIAP